MMLSLSLALTHEKINRIEMRFFFFIDDYDIAVCKTKSAMCNMSITSRLKLTVLKFRYVSICYGRPIAIALLKEYKVEICTLFVCM